MPRNPRLERERLNEEANMVLMRTHDARFGELAAAHDRSQSEADLIALCDYFEQRICEELMRVARHDREAVECIIDERLARSSEIVPGVI